MQRGERAREPLAARAALAADRREEVDRGARCRRSLRDSASRSRPAPARVSGAGSELRERQRVEQLEAAPEDADVRSVELVRRARQEIAADRPHVDQLVRREVHRVDEHAARRPRARSSRRARRSVIVPIAFDAAPTAISFVRVVDQRREMLESSCPVVADHPRACGRRCRDRSRARATARRCA